MNANELLYGIYVYFNCFDGSKITVKVTGFKDGVVYGVSEHGSHWCNIRKVEPIPLTAEILEQNGFEKIKIAYTFNKYRYLCSLKKNRVFIDCIPYSNENLIVPNWFGVQVVENELDAQAHLNSSCTIPCAYVHELQKALSICKIKKTIEL